MTTAVTTEVEEVDVTGGASGPPSANAGTVATVNRHTSASVVSSLFIERSPFLRMGEQDIVLPKDAFAPYLFAHFWQLRSAGRTHDALTICDHLLELIDPSDFDSHLRQTNARAICQRDLLNYRAAYRTHLSARPFLTLTKDDRIAGDHHHGLGVTLTELGEHVSAYRNLESARKFYVEAGEAERVPLVDINSARLLVRMNKPALAYELIEAACASTVEHLKGHAELARALAYEAEGRLLEAEASAFLSSQLIAQTGDRTALDESMRTWQRIKGKR
jgi:tetratricopeptide (TPR) repeat protein